MMLHCVKSIVALRDNLEATGNVIIVIFIVTIIVIIIFKGSTALLLGLASFPLS
jgi:hypothetical protein